MVHFILTNGEFKYQYYIAVLSAVMTQKEPVILWTAGNLIGNFPPDLIPKIELRLLSEFDYKNFPALKGKGEHFVSAHTKDYLAYAILYKYGGTCLDLDTLCLSDITELIGDNEMMIATDAYPPEKYEYAFNSAILSAKKGSYVVRELEYQARQILQKEDMKWGETGPMLVSDIVRASPGVIMVPPWQVCGGFKEMYTAKPIPSHVKVIHFYAFSAADRYERINEDYVKNSPEPVAEAIRKVLGLNKNRKFFIEIGANYFETLNHLGKEGWDGIIVEPVPEYFEKIEKLPNIHYEMVAVGTEPSVKNFYYIPEQEVERNKISKWARGLGSLEKHPDITKRGWEKLVNRILVPVVTMDYLLDKFHVKHIDYLKIDTEGYDCRILLGMDLSIVDKILFEHKHASKDELLKVILKLQDFRLTLKGDNIEAIRIIK